MIAANKNKNITTLIVCTLAVIIATACGSSSDEPASGAALADEIVASKILLSEAARDAGCPSEIQGFEITLSDTRISAETLKRVGGVCVLGEAAYETAHAFAQEAFVSSFCDLAQNVADELGDGDYALAHQKVTEYVKNGQASRSDAQPMLRALSGCVSSQTKSETAASMVSSTSARIYSVGTYTENGHTCDGVLWSQGSSSIEEHYRLTGLNGCTLQDLSSSVIFHPEARPEGRLLGDYFRDALAYTGDMPARFRYKGDDYPFYTSETSKVLVEQNPVINVSIEPQKKTTLQFRNWAYTNEHDPIGIAYVVSNYSRYAANAAYIVRADTGNHEIYVHSNKGCDGRDYVNYKTSSTHLHLPASCVEVGESGIRYTVALGDRSDTLRAAMKSGASMEATPFSMTTESPRARDPLTFSLMGFTSASSQLKADFDRFDSEQQRQLARQGLGEQAQTAVFEDISKPRKVQAPAAAKPATQASSGPDFVQRYATNLANQMEEKYHPACGAIASHIRNVARSSAPDAVRMRQVEAMVDRAPSACF